MTAYMLLAWLCSRCYALLLSVLSWSQSGCKRRRRQGLLGVADQCRNLEFLHDMHNCMICCISYALQQISNGVQVKDPSKAASASEADIKDLVQFRGEELKKDTLAEAKTDNKRYDQVALSHMLCASMYTSLLDRSLLCGLQNFHRD